MFSASFFIKVTKTLFTQAHKPRYNMQKKIRWNYIIKKYQATLRIYSLALHSCVQAQMLNGPEQFTSPEGINFFLQQIAWRTEIFFSTYYVSMTLTIYICYFFLFKLSDSRQSLCRPDGCINIRVKILLKHFGMQVLLAKC